MARILLLLRAHPTGLTTDDLLERVGYGELSTASRMRALHRDLAALAAEGWRIDTAETANTPARRVLRTVDNRFATLFTPQQRAQLARAALCAGPEVADTLADDLGRDPGPPTFVALPTDGLGRLSVCQSAAADRCLLRFTYNGSPRTVHPMGVLLRPGGWYLRGLDEGDGIVKQFAVDRMRALHRAAPGTARPGPASAAEPLWDFMRQRVHEPITVTVDTTEEHLARVLSALAANGHALVDSPDPDRVRLEVVVTSTSALLDRILELGERGRLIGPEDVRERLRDRLQPWVAV
jgi:hypothetical protein